ncbi:MAG: aminomethyl-transferring glycine dehydrogenase, partial [Bdellovibrio sp.]
FGVPLGNGGPHAAFLATRDSFKRSLPGRLVGVSVDSRGQKSLRLTLQTREQHIRREKATSNICTAQVLLANMASMYAVYHGPRGLKKIAERIHHWTSVLARNLREHSYSIRNSHFFDTLRIQTPKAAELTRIAEKRGINFLLVDQEIGISLNECVGEREVREILSVFGISLDSFAPAQSHLPMDLLRSTPYLTHPVFNSHHSESQLLRYITQLQSQDLTLAHSMIPLGSCTMKLNAASELAPVSWPEVNKIHPFAPLHQMPGYVRMIQDLEEKLCDITGFAGVSLQPNAGSQGEYAGLLVIRKYLAQKSQSHRRICLIPSSAHGTNPASAVMAGFEVVVVACDAQGNVDIADLKKQAEAYRDQLAALMVTYPSTHGVFEEGISEICDIVHSCGGQVYMDGANLNALVGFCRPGEFGPDVCHMNLHKTFAIPHGGGGPGVGPIGVAAHLKDFLPTHALQSAAGPASGISATTSAPWGSASILPISWMYISMMGEKGLQKATLVAILNANYMARKLDPYYPVLYKGKNGDVAHECIIDLRSLKKYQIEVTDVAKRLMDYGFHAPTMSWPVAGTLMIEPTESEGKAEMDRFIDAMISIRQEIGDIEVARLSAEQSPLR